MCYLAVHHRVRADAPLVLLANRDEAYDRPFDPPHWWGDAPDVFAPRDRSAGGTWMGMSRAGLVAAITNRGKPLGGAPLRSRGQLVVDVLRQPDPPTAVAWLHEHLLAEPYEGFHLLVADRSAAFVVRHEGAHTPHVPGDDDVASDWSGRSSVLTNLHEVGALSVPPSITGAEAAPLGDWIARHEQLARDDTSVLPGDHRILKRSERRGTVCSAVLVLRPDGATFRFANGAPDVAPFETVLEN